MPSGEGHAFGVLAPLEVAYKERCIDSPLRGEEVRRGVDITPVADRKQDNGSFVVQMFPAPAFVRPPTEGENDLGRGGIGVFLKYPIQCRVLGFGQLAGLAPGVEHRTRHAAIVKAEDFAAGMVRMFHNEAGSPKQRGYVRSWKPSIGSGSSHGLDSVLQRTLGVAYLCQQLADSQKAAGSSARGVLGQLAKQEKDVAGHRGVRVDRP